MKRIEITRGEALITLVASFLLAVVMTWPQVKMISISGFSPDIMRNVWVLQWDFHALLTDPLNLFNANIFYPAHNTLALNDHLLGALPIWLLFYLPTGDAHGAFNLTGIAMYALMAWGTYLLARRLTGSTAGAAAAGLFAAFHQAKMYHYGLLPVVSHPWFPLMLLGLEYYRETGGGKWLLLVGSLYAILLMSGYYNAYASSLALGAYLVVSWVQGREWRRPSRVLLPALALAFAVALNVPITLPYIYQESGKAISNPVEGNVRFPSDLPSDIFKSAPANKIYGKWMGMGDYKTPQPLFPGVAFPLFVLLGIVVLRRKGAGERDILWRFGLPGLLAASISLGPRLVINGDSTAIPLPYAFFAAVLPGFNNIRAPQRFMYTALIFGAIFAAYGVRGIIKWGNTIPISKIPAIFKNRVVSSGFLGVLCVAAALADVWSAPLYRTNKPEFKGVPEVYKWMRGADIKGGTLELPFSSENHVYEALYTYMSVYHWKPIVNGYSAYAPRSYHRFGRAVKLLPDEAALRLLDMAGVEIIIEHGDVRDWLVDPSSAPYMEPPPDTVAGTLDKARGKGLVLVERFGKDALWRINLEPVPTIAVGVLNVMSMFRTPDGEDVMVMEVKGDSGRIWKNADPDKPLDAVIRWHKIGRGVALERPVKIPLPIAALGSPISDIYVFSSFPDEADVYELEIRTDDNRIRSAFQRVTLDFEAMPDVDAEGLR